MINFKKFTNLIFFFVIFTFTFQTNSFAYLDPGSTSFILQVLSIVLASILFCYNYIKNKIILFFQKLKKNFKNKKDDQQ